MTTATAKQTVEATKPAEGRTEFMLTFPEPQFIADMETMLTTANMGNSRYTLDCVRFEVRGGDACTVTLVSTDAKRLTVLELKRTNLREFGDYDFSIDIASIKAAVKVCRASNKRTDVGIYVVAKGDLVVSATFHALKVEKAGKVQREDVELPLSLSEGRFPRWRDVVPNYSGATRIEARSGELSEVCRLMANFGEFADLTAGVGRIKLSAGGVSETSVESRAEASCNQMHIDYVCPDGKRKQISGQAHLSSRCRINPAFIGDYLATLPGDGMCVAIEAIEDGANVALPVRLSCGATNWWTIIMPSV